MKNLITIIFLFFAISASAQDWQLKGTKYPNATNEGDTVSLQSRLPMLDENGLLNYYLPVADLLALNPAPVLEWGNITGTLSNQTDLQGALNDKADQSDLTAHTSNGNIHFTQSAISITESQVSDLKDYLRGDINDTNGANKLTLGSLEVTGQTILQNGLNMSSVPVGTSDNILTLNTVNGDVEQRVFSLGDIDIANAAGTSQFPVGLGDQLRIQGSGDTSISFDGVTNTININSTPGSGGGGAVTSFNGRDGAVVSQAGDYSTAMVNENTNLYFTEARVRGTDLAGLAVTNTPISSTNTFLQALGRLQGQINNREPSFSKNTAFNKNFGTSAGTVLEGNWRPTWSQVTGKPSTFPPSAHSHTFASITNKPTTLSGYGITDAYTKSVSDGKYTLSTTTITAGTGLTGGGALSTDRTLSFDTTWGDNRYVGISGNETITGLKKFTGSSGVIELEGAAPILKFAQIDGALDEKNTWLVNDGNIFSFRFYKDDFSGYETPIIIRRDGVTTTSFEINSSQLTTSGNITATGNITGNNLSGTNTGDQTLSGLGGVPTSRTISTTSGLSGGGTLAANRTISPVTEGTGFTLVPQRGRYGAGTDMNDWLESGIYGTQNSHVNEPEYISYDPIFVLRNSDTGAQIKIPRNTGSIEYRGYTSGGSNFTPWIKVWDSRNLSPVTTVRLINTGTGLSGGGTLASDRTLSITSIAAGSGTVGALRYNGTTKSAGRLYGGSSNPSSTTRLNYDGHLFVSELTSIGDVVANSDKRLKKNIKRIDNALAIVQLLGGYEYDRKDIDLHQAGVIAQEVEEVFPTAVSEDEKGIKSVAYNQLIALLIEAVKEQQIEIENLKTLINEK